MGKSEQSLLWVWFIQYQVEVMDSVLIYDIESEIASECAGEEEKGVIEQKKEEKETDISDVPRSKIIQVRPPQFAHQNPPRKQEHEQQHENIIFYEEDLTKSINSIDIDETNRGLLKNQQDDSEQDSEYNEEECDEVGELEQYEQPKKRMKEHERLEMVPQQMRLKNQTVVVQANTQLFIKQVVPPNYSINCVIDVERNLLGLASSYRLFLQDGQQFLLSAKKEVFKLSSSFLISRHPTQIHKRSSIYQGRLQGNFIGTEYRLLTAKDQVETLKLLLKYQKNIIGFNGPRNFTVTKLSPNVQPSFRNSLEAILERNEKSKLMQLETARPILKKGKFRMDFGGKVKLPSAKNFIIELQMPKGQRRRSLLFGKIAQDKYIMQVQYPLTVFQAFGISLTSLDSKLMVN